MTTALETTDTLDLTIGDDAIADMAERYMGLKVKDISDNVGIAAVHEARMVVKRKRIDIEKKRKELNEDAVAWQKTVNTEAKRLTALLTPIEDHLEQEESIVEREKERKRQEAEAQRRETIKYRLQSLAEAGYVCQVFEVEYMEDLEFANFLAEKRAEKKARDDAAAAEATERARVAEQQRIEAERLATERAELDKARKEQEAAAAETKRIADEKLAAERAELERQRAEQSAAQAKIDAENKRIADAEAAAKRAAELEQAKRDAAEQAKRDAEAKAKQEADAAAAKAIADEAERQRVEALRPDKEKIAAFADAVQRIELPTLSKKSAKASTAIAQHMLTAAAAIRATGKGLR